MLFYIISFLILILLVYFSKSNENFNNNNILSLNEIYQKNALMNNIEYVGQGRNNIRDGWSCLS